MQLINVQTVCHLGAPHSSPCCYASARLLWTCWLSLQVYVCVCVRLSLTPFFSNSFRIYQGLGVFLSHTQWRRQRGGEGRSRVLARLLLFFSFLLTFLAFHSTLSRCPPWLSGGFSAFLRSDYVSLSPSLSLSLYAICDLKIVLLIIQSRLDYNNL